jgi:hypothetical protein
MDLVLELADHYLLDAVYDKTVPLPRDNIWRQVHIGFFYVLLLFYFVILDAMRIIFCTKIRFRQTARIG